MGLMHNVEDRKEGYNFGPDKSTMAVRPGQRLDGDTRVQLFAIMDGEKSNTCHCI
jgi:hypothetical protein